jgi:hypothetical protein
MSLNYESLTATLGKDWSDPSVQALVRSLPGTHELERMEQLAFLECREKGIQLAFKDALYLASGGKKYTKDGPVTLVALHLHSAGYEGYLRFSEGLPGGLSFEDGRSEVHEKMGLPSASGGGNEALGRVWPYWERYDRAGHAIRVQYAREQNRIDIVMLMAPSEIPD